MATARAFSIPDIGSEIIEHLHTEPASKRRPLLAGLVRVSRTFRDPVERMLWAELPTLEPLFRLLSNCVSMPSPVTAAGNGGQIAQPSYTLALHGPTLDDEIARLREYARRVRILDFHRAGRPWDSPSKRPPRGLALDPHSLEYLLSRTGLPFLPSLTKLNLPISPPYHSDPTFLICPSLLDLTISFPDRSARALSDNHGVLLGEIFGQNSPLTHLRVQSEYYMYHDPKDESFTPWMIQHTDWMFDPVQFTHTLFHVVQTQSQVSETPSQVFYDALAAVSKLNCLEVFSMLTLKIGVAGRNLVVALSALPRLRDCSFGIDIAADMLSTITPGFASLRVLAVSNVVHGIEFRLFNSPLLQDLTIYHPNYVDNDSYRRTLEVVAKQFPHLQCLVWKLGRMNKLSADRILAITVQPLFAVHGLQELFIDVMNRPVHDDDIALLVGGLPCLVCLELKFNMDNTGPSARSLLTLAQGCPTLHTLHLDGIIITKTDKANAETYPYVGNSLRCLTITDLRCEGETYSAMLIDMFFPFLDIRECRRRATKAIWPTGPSFLRCWII